MLSRGKLMVKKALEDSARKVIVQNTENVYSHIGTLDQKFSEENNRDLAHIEDNNYASTSSTDLLTSEPSGLTQANITTASMQFMSDDGYKDYHDGESRSEYVSSSDEYVPSGNKSDESSSSKGEYFENEETIENIRAVSGTLFEIPNIPNTDTQLNVKPKKLKIFPDKPKICKKRVRQPATWKRSEAAANRARGKKYLSQKGYEVAEKKVCLENLCTDKCRLECSKNFNIDIRKTIFNEFYLLDINSKNSLLFKSIVGRPTKRIVKLAKKHKSSAYDYVITRHNKQIKVCKTAFCALLQISKKKVEIIQKKLQRGSSAPSLDQRGHHFNRPHKMSDEVVEYIKDHIGQFPAESSHYSRNSNPHKMYLAPNLNISIMYRLYLEKCENENKPDNFKIKKTSYANIFSTKFNLSFSHPKSDTCGKCDSGESNEEHQENVKRGFDLLKFDREIALTNDDVLYLTVDLQQTMPLPKLTTSKAFYLRQLWFYNLGIHAVSTDGEKPYMQTWTENIANRGSIEVISSLWNFMQNSDQVKTRNHLRLWSDSCAGQNKNFQMIYFFQFLLLKGMFKSIEKVLRKTETVYTPDQYRNLIQKASKKGSTVNNMEHLFYDFEKLAANMGLMTRKMNTLNEKVNVRDEIKWIRIEKFGSYMYKESYDPYTPFKEVNLLKNPSRVQVPEVKLVRFMHKTGSISNEKLENLKQQMKYIPEQHRWFYDELLVQSRSEEPQPAKKRRTN